MKPCTELKEKVEIKPVSNSNPFFSIIIPCFNCFRFLKKAIDSILAQSFSHYELIIVDNGSTDELSQWKINNTANFRYLRLPENKGFPYAVNRGVEVSKGEYLLIMNADVFLDKDFLLNFKERIKISPEIGLWQPLVLYPDGKRVYTTGLLISRARRFYNIGEGEEREKWKEEREIWGPAGCCMVCKKEVFEDVGGFDEDFFFLLEDFDFAWRANKKGWKARFFPGAVAYHWGRVTFDQYFRQYLSFRNRYLLLVKNEDFKSIIRDLPYILLYDFLRIPYFSILNPYSFRAWRELIPLLRKMRRKRWKQQSV